MVRSEVKSAELCTDLWILQVWRSAGKDYTQAGNWQNFKIIPQDCTYRQKEERLAPGQDCDLICGAVGEEEFRQIVEYVKEAPLRKM
jgi:hypothetical protein